MKSRKLFSLALALIVAFSLIPTQSAFAYSVAGAGQHQTLALKGSRTFFIKEDGSLWGCGDNYHSVLGNNRSEQETQYEPIKIMDNVVSVSAGGNFAVAIKSDGSLWGWGDNGTGQLGIGKAANGNGGAGNMTDPQANYNNYQSVPIKIMDNVASVSTGYYHTLVLKTDGSVWAFGDNGQGQIGKGFPKEYGSDTDQYTPIKIMSNAVSVCAGDWTSMAITSNKELWAWGSNSSGQLGNGLVGDRTFQNGPSYEVYQSTPVKVMDNVITVSASAVNTMAITSDNVLWGWGLNKFGNLANGTGASETTPHKIMENVAGVSTGEHYSMAIKTDSSLWAWGLNFCSALGSGLEGNVQITESSLYQHEYYQTEPIKVMDDVAAVAASSSSTIAIRSDGSMWGWGSNAWGNLCNSSMGGKGPLKEPTKIMDGISKSNLIIFQPKTAAPTSSAIIVDGEKLSFDAYVIDGNNYVKLRDIACALRSTNKEFEVMWLGEENAIKLLTTAEYTFSGSEFVQGDGTVKSATINKSDIFLDSKRVWLTGYTINGNNYFKLRDLGSTFNFGVDWEGSTSTVIIDTSKGYTK